VATRTTRDHLQAKADELAIELRSAEERLEVLQSRPSIPNGTQGPDEEPPLSHEQELAVEVSELKRDLELNIAELYRVNEQIEVYKGISQSTEERLQELVETNDQYRQETESALEEKDSKIKNLEQRIEDITSELSTSDEELSKLRDLQSESTRRLEEQKTSFEAEITRLKEQEERNAEQAQFNLEATKAQAEIATEAQQNYENELVKHAEAATTAQNLRAQNNNIRLEMVNLRTQAESAKTDLAQKGDSWSEMKHRYEQEVSDLRKRRDEASQQNSILHSQLEALTAQITTLQRDRAAIAPGESGESAGPGLESLQEVIKYLRREKEIVDVQFHLQTL
jgi:nucleoprotein TPR